MGVSCRSWGFTPAGAEVQLFTLKNSSGCKADISTFGAALIGLEIPRKDNTIDVVLGFDSLEEYMNDGNYMGATVGRVAGRISNASFNLDSQKIRLDSNEGPNHLHGGKNGFSSRVWEIAACNRNDEAPAITLSLHSPDGTNGYPGNLLVETTFTLKGTTLRIDYRAITDQPTPLNMTGHPYFNLNGNGCGISSHELKLHAIKSAATDKAMIPTGEINNISGTAADFTQFTPLGNTAQDRFYVLDNEQGELVPAAIGRCNESGLEMEILTTQPGMQLYTADGIAPGTAGKKGSLYGPRYGFCIEPMGYPDAVNHPEFPSVILNPGEKYHHSTEYRFRNFTAVPEND
ncbi:aldose epimerase family protein [Maridesulfovibrio sp.]|uniref:aldose epimerase family protein n=1 Tax=Maridesulfovibrio sp. TaxID=2795000 RepID=UPI0039F14DA9